MVDEKNIFKKCKKCSELKNRQDFYNDKRNKDGLYSCCKKCSIEYSKKTYIKYNYLETKREYRNKYQKEYQKTENIKKYKREYNKEYYSKEDDNIRLKYLCRNKTRNYIIKGIIKKEPCKICGCIKSETHHINYESPFNILFLCRKHHSELHSGKISYKDIFMENGCDNNFGADKKLIIIK